MELSKFSRIFSVVVALASAALFAIATPLSKIFIRELNPFLLAGLLYLGAGIGLIPFGVVGLKGMSVVRLKSNSKLLGGMILFGGILGPLFLLGALRSVSASSVSLWLNLELVATAILGHFLFKDFLSKRGWLGVALSVMAGALLSLSEGGAGISAGILVAFACLCWGFDNHFAALIDNLSPVQSTVIKGIFAGGTNLLVGLMLSNWHISLRVLWQVMVVGFFCYGISLVLYIHAAQKIGAVRGQLFFATASFWAVLFSVFLLKESISIAQIVSGALLLGSVWLILTEKHAHCHEHAAMEHSHLHTHDDLHHGHQQDGKEGAHSHFHKHVRMAHAHPHWPDLHHRHGH